jgi:hypothetical protein
MLLNTAIDCKLRHGGHAGSIHGQQNNLVVFHWIWHQDGRRFIGL